MKIMTHEEYLNKVKELENQLLEVTQEYIDSNKIYNIGDYLKISFKTNNKLIVKVCKIINIYPAYGNNFNGTMFCKWPKGELIYFAKYAHREKNNKIYIGNTCYLGQLSHSNLICGYANINWNDIKIEVIKESDI